MDRKLYKAAKEGNIEDLEGAIRGSHTQMGNNVLHIAAKYGHVDFVRVVLENRADMAKKTNSRGNSPLHLAARNGHEEVVKLIVSKFRHSKGNRLMEGPNAIDTPGISRMEDGEVGSELKQLLRMGNKEGNTALHEALGNGKEGVGLVLWEEDHELVGVVNRVKESPLYICAEWGFDTTLKRMVNYLVEQCTRGDEDLGKQEALQQLLDAAVSGPDEQNPLHAAVIAGSHECTKSLVDFETSICFPFNVHMMNKPNHIGRTPLHFTAAIVKDKLLARYLLQGGPSPSYMKDNDGRTPLLQAAESGNLIVMKEILEHCPDTIEICDNQGRNAMHLTIYGGTLKPKQIYKVQELIELVNEPDDEGSTPLHMAAENQSYRMLKTLIQVGANIRAKNASGKTAWDICEQEWPASEKKKYLYNYLKYFTIRRDGKPQKWKFTTKKSSPLDDPKADLKGMANTLSVVAVLIATLTFAAAFTLPGGYESSDNHNGRNPNELITRIAPSPISPSPCTLSDGPDDDKHRRIGESVLIDKPSLQAFIVADVLAVTCSLSVVFILISSMLADAAFLRSAIVYSKKLLYIALGGTMVVFMTGLYTVISRKKFWVAIGVCIMGSSIPFVIAYFRRKSFTSNPIILHHIKRSMTRTFSSIFQLNTMRPAQTFDEAVAEEKIVKGRLRLPKSPWSNKNATT